MTGLVGRALPRLEDRRFLTGTGRYMADIVQPDALHLHMIRSPHAHARLVAIDALAAWALPGVAGIFTGADLIGLEPIPCSWAGPTIGPLHVPARFALATDRVRHVGEPVGFVIAETARQAEDAAELVSVAYDPLPCVVEAVDALAAGAPVLWDGVVGNLAFRFEKGDRAGVDAAMAQAAHVIALRLVNNRIIVAPIEHRGALGRFDAERGEYSLLLSGQGVHGIRADLARVLGVAEVTVQVACPDVGGGFGVKNPLYPEYIVALWAARRMARPIRWACSHGEDFVSTVHGRDNLTHARLGLDAAGRFLALDVDIVANLGAGMSAGGPGSSTTAPGNAMGGGYDIPAVFMATRGAFTNTVPVDAYRGAGKPEATYLIERLIDEAARVTGMNRVALRRRNLVSAFPHRTAMATTIDGGRFAAAIDPALDRADAAGFAERRAASAERGRLRGLGVTCFLETARGAPNEGAEVRFREDGRVSLHLGTQSNGQGHETSFPQIAADRLGLPIEAFDYVQADTRQVRAGHGHGGARSLHLGGSALVDAIGLVLSKAHPIAATLLQAGMDEVAFSSGRFAAGERSVGLLEVARAASAAGEPLDSYHWTLLDLITFPNGCHVAEVEVDPETGSIALLRYTAVDDFGDIVNPMLLVGQVQGGVAQGIGQALMERTAYDRTTGQLLSGSFMDYALPRAADLPNLDVHLFGVPTRSNPLGVKGAGQAGAIAAPPAVVAAVLDALGPVGVSDLDMPLTPERVWRAIRHGLPGGHAPPR